MDDRETGYATENVVEPAPEEDEAMAAWVAAIVWATQRYAAVRAPDGETLTL